LNVNLVQGDFVNVKNKSLQLLHNSTLVCYEVTILNDIIVEPNQLFQIELTSAGSHSQSIANVTIIDDVRKQFGVDYYYYYHYSLLLVFSTTFFFKTII